MVPGFQISGTILEMGGLAHQRTGYQIGEEVVVHNYPACGGLAESCLVHYRVRRICLKKQTLIFRRDTFVASATTTLPSELMNILIHSLVLLKE